MTFDSSNSEAPEIDDSVWEDYTDEGELFVADTFELADLGELYDEGTPCHACFGTGLDRELDSDCLTCWGDGIV